MNKFLLAIQVQLYFILFCELYEEISSLQLRVLR